MCDEATYIIAGCRPWNRLLFDANRNDLPRAQWIFVARSPEAIRARATYWGSVIGAPAAEAFVRVFGKSL